MNIETIPINKINPAPYNPRRDLQPGDPEYEKLKKSLAEFDLVEPLIWNSRTGNLVGGHQRLKILQARGDKDVEVSVVDLPEKKEKALNLALNKISGEWDYPKLKDILEELDTGGFDMEITGFDDSEIEDLMTQFFVPGEGLTPDDEIPEKVETVCKTGDLWKLGEHRLLCGDATKKEDVERLMGGEKADLCLTGPPYGIGETFGDYIDSSENLTQLINGFLPLARENSKRILLTPGNLNQFLYPKPDWVLAWFCSAGVGVNPWGYTCWNAIFAYGKDPYLQVGKGSRPDAMVRNEVSEKLNHPTVKPIGVWNWILERGSIKVGDMIFDPFGGSGTTLIACEKLGRKCRMMEISEMYTSVILKRWEAYTGKQAVLVSGATDV